MSNYSYRFMVVACLLSLGSTNAFAGDTSQTNTVKTQAGVVAKLTAFKVTLDNNKKELFSPVDKVAPADLLKYEVIYLNNGKSLLKQLTATLPLPVGTTYVLNSAQPTGAMASLDGKNFAVVPLKRMVKKANGTTNEQLVPLSEYRALRWVLGA